MKNAEAQSENFMLTVSRENREEVQQLISEYASSPHLDRLTNLFEEDHVSIESLLYYGLDFLPKIIDQNGQKNIDLLESFEPQVTEYYEILSRCSFLPTHIKDVCTDLSAYANGSSIEIMDDVYNFDPEKAIKNALTVK